MMKHFLRTTMVSTIAISALLTSGVVYGQSKQELQRKVSALEKELSEARGQLEAMNAEAEQHDAKIQVGDVTIGGAIRANYVIGDYTGDMGPGRGGHGGNFELDTFRINLDYASGCWVAKGEYRWYNGYNFLHTGWVGYNFANESQLQVGVNRVPFGPGPYGVSQSWFFDQHYYLGLADDMDLGVKYTLPLENLTLDCAYYVTGEGDWRGAGKDSARYSYDVVDETGSGYEERHQANLRAIYKLSVEDIDTDVGMSLQYGTLRSEGPQDDGDHYALSGHVVNRWNNWVLSSQLTYFNHDVENHTLTSGTISNKLVDMGAFDFGWPVAAEGYIPATSLAYKLDTPNVAWLDYVMPYVEYSSIIKEHDAFNDSELLTLGAAWARGGWYMYTDIAYSNGNYFVGNEGDDYSTNSVGDFGVNGNDDWATRFNINFGYYF